MRTNPFPRFFQRSRILVVLVLLIALPHSLDAQSRNRCQRLSDPLDKLKCGNTRFENNKYFEEERRRASGPQHPYSTILSCSDSRVPPEIVFSETTLLARLFIVRVAGNVIDPTIPGSTDLASIEYAVSHDCKLLFVMAHESCGAVIATMDAVRNHKDPDSPNLLALVNSIRPNLDLNRLDTEIPEDVAVNVNRNLRGQMENVVKKSPYLAGELQKGKLRIVGAIYQLVQGDAKPIYYCDRNGEVRPITQAKAGRPN
jgi:carbonic anhydrase